MTQVKNTSESRRRWDNLVDTGTQRTLELDPGECADVELPEDFEDPHLAVTPPLSPRKAPVVPSEPLSPPVQVDSPSDPPKE